MNKHILLGSAVLFSVVLWQANALAQSAASPVQLAQQETKPTGKETKPPPPGAKPPTAGAKPVAPVPGAPGQAQTPTTTPPPHIPGQAPPPHQPGQVPPAALQGQPTLPPGHEHRTTPGTGQTPTAIPAQPHTPGPGQAVIPGQPHTPTTGPGQTVTPTVPGQPHTPTTGPGQTVTPTVPGQPHTPTTGPGQAVAPALPGQPHTPVGGAAVRPVTPGGAPAAAQGQPPAGAKPPVGRVTALPPPPAPAQGQALRPVALTGTAAPAPIGAGGQPLRHVNDIRKERKEVVEGGRTIIREPDRTIIRENGQTIIQHNEVDRFTFNAKTVTTQRQGDTNLTIVVRPDGAQIITVVDLNGQLVRRLRRDPSGREIVIIDNRPPNWRPDSFYVELAPPVIRIPRERYALAIGGAVVADIFAVLAEPPVEPLERRYSLDEIRYSDGVRDRMPHIDIDTVNFESGSWEVAPDQVDRLAPIADSINRLIARNPAETFLIEGYTDAVGSVDDNLSLSDRRAEAVAVLLTNQFQVPPENLSSQGYGKEFLKIPTDGPERANRRVAIRRITPLLMGQN